MKKLTFGKVLIYWQILLAVAILYLSRYYFELMSEEGVGEIIINIPALLVINDIDEFFDQVMTIYLYYKKLENPLQRKVTIEVN